MKWLWIVPLLFVGLIALIVLVGLLLPKHHTASRTARFKQPSAKVWSLIETPQSYKVWAPVKSIEMLPPRDGQEAWKIVQKSGDSLSLALVERTPPSRLVTRIIDATAFGGTWTWVITPVGDDSCTLSVTEDGDVHNPIFRFVTYFFMGHHGTIDAHLKALAGHLGESVVIE